MEMATNILVGDIKINGVTIPLDGIIPIWQPIGESTNHLARKLANKIGVLTSHTGTIDPMAQGVIIVLSGETRNKKYEYATWQKEYEFEVVFCISTDTYDGMGLVTENDVANFYKNNFAKSTNQTTLDEKILPNFIKNLEQKLSDFVGPYTQRVPAYSSVKFMHKPLHHHARSLTAAEAAHFQQTNLPTKSGQIFDLKIIKVQFQTLEKMLEKVFKNIDLVAGDFRQDLIKNNWKAFVYKVGSDQTLLTAKFKVKMSKGLYVRSLALDIAKKINTVGFVSELTRTSNGIYNKANSIPLNVLNL